MSQRATSSDFSLYLEVAGVALLVVLAAAAGWWLGGQSEPVEEQFASNAAETKAVPAASEAKTPAVPPPLYFHVHVPSAANQGVVADEVAMAAEAGIHQYVIDVPLPWDGDMNAFLRPIALVVQGDPHATFFLLVDLNAPPSWGASHPDEMVRVAGKPGAYASLASEVWRREARSTLEALVSAMMTSEHPERVLGYIVGCLESGRWHRSDGNDASSPNTTAFRDWLIAKYREDAALQKSWGDEKVSFESVLVPETANIGVDCPVFSKGAESQRYAGYNSFASQVTADTIIAFVRHIKQAGDSPSVFAAYGYSYEITSGSAGHFALSRLLETEIDGFISPVSYEDRGLGGAGGPMGPIHSVISRGKQWLLIDDTRTGVERDPATGEIARPKNLRADDVYCVQQRNFAAAMTQGLGLIWSDPQGEGWLHDREMWRNFAKFWSIYARNIEERGQTAPTPAVPSEDNEALRHPRREEEDMQLLARSSGGPVLAVVVDEDSRFYGLCDTKINEILLNQGRDSAIRTGVATRFYLLRDVITGKVPFADVYLFLNAFHLTVQDRELLHAVLEEKKAAAIWMYAPGYIADEASVDNISATTRIATKAFDASEESGSVFLLPANWMNKGDEFGASVETEPLFYIDDPNTNVLANFSESGKPSLAMSFFENSWTSVFCAEPGVTPAVLRQILRLLEMHVHFQVTPTKFFDASSFGPDLISVHAKETGERVIELDHVCDVRDLLSPEIGWPRKRTVSISMKTGETRLLKLSPVAVDAVVAPESQPLAQ